MHTTSPNELFDGRWLGSEIDSGRAYGVSLQLHSHNAYGAETNARIVGESIARSHKSIVIDGARHSDETESSLLWTCW